MAKLLIGAIVVTVTLTLLQYRRHRNLRKLLIVLGSLGLILALGIIGTVMRVVFPLYITHLLLIGVAWLALLYYLLRNRYYWWLIFSPLITIGLFLLLELLEGSGHNTLG